MRRICCSREQYALATATARLRLALMSAATMPDDIAVCALIATPHIGLLQLAYCETRCARMPLTEHTFMLTRQTTVLTHTMLSMT